MIIGCALFVDVLQPVSILSLTLQDDEVDVVQGIKSILKSHKSLKKLSSKDPSEWPVTKVVLSRLKDQHGGKIYQGAELHHYNTIESCNRQALSDLISLDDHMKS